MAIELNAGIKSRWRYLGDAYSAKENYSKAIECYRKAVKIDPEDEKTWTRLNQIIEVKRTKEFDPKEVEILRGGNWMIEGNQSYFHFKVKVHNRSHFTLTDIQILLHSIPEGLEVISDRHKLLKFPLIFRLRSKKGPYYMQN